MWVLAREGQLLTKTREANLLELGYPLDPSLTVPLMDKLPRLAYGELCLIQLSSPCTSHRAVRGFLGTRRGTHHETERRVRGSIPSHTFYKGQPLGEGGAVFIPDSFAGSAVDRGSPPLSVRVHERTRRHGQAVQDF